jgi:hypothetical protein
MMVALVAVIECPASIPRHMVKAATNTCTM